jgi:2-keto-myo-inositol isomerase
MRERGESSSMKAEKLTINSQCTFHWNLEEALDAYAAAGFRNVERT